MTITRFAPSPTGRLHVGNLRTALFNHLIARRDGGRFILRLDDTDPERTREEHVESIRADLRWLGLDWHEERRQSARLEHYAAAAARLREAGRLYECFETPEELEIKRRAQRARGLPPVYDRSALRLGEDEKARLRAERPSHWRFRLDHERIGWEDGILGTQSIDAASVSDPVLIRADGQVLYTLASVVDDIEMGITHVVRGADHVTNTATQIQIIRALGATPPAFAHHSLLTGPAGEALSKRLGSLALGDLRAEGIEAVALTSMMARLGSGHAIELADLDRLAAGFDLADFGAAPTKFDPAELRALSARAVHGLPFREVAGEIAALGVPDSLAPAFWEVVRENITRRDEMAAWWAILEGRAIPEIAPGDETFVAEALRLLPDPPYDGESWKRWTDTVKERTGRKGKALFLPLRKALTGRGDGPDMAKLMPLFRTRPGGMARA